MQRWHKPTRPSTRSGECSKSMIYFTRDRSSCRRWRKVRGHWIFLLLEKLFELCCLFDAVVSLKDTKATSGTHSRELINGC
jgi:hypothetical protein